MNNFTDPSQLNKDMPEISNAGFDISSIINILWLRKRVLISVTFFISFLAVLYVYQLVPRYTATTQLLIGINKAKVLDIQEVLSGSAGKESAVAGELEVIKSRELAHKIIKVLNLNANKEFNPSLKPPEFLAQFNPKNLIPESWKEASGSVQIDTRTEAEKHEAELTNLTNVFLSKLKLLPVKNSQVINLSFETEDPKLSQKLANALADGYIVGQLQAKFDATKKATDWLNDQLGNLKQKLQDSEHAVEHYRKTHDMIELNSGNDIAHQEFTSMNSQLIDARSKRVEAELKYQQVEAVLLSGRDINSVAEVLNSPIISGLRAKESNIESKYSEMLVEYGPRHPKMIQMQAELADIKAKIELDLKKIAVGLNHNLDVAKARENSLEVSLRQMESKASVNNQAGVELHALEREANANKALFETFLNRFKETASTQGIEQADARVISFAEMPLAASFPRKNFLLGISFTVALIVAIGMVFILEMLNPGVRSPEQVQQLFNMATLGIVPMVTENIKMQPYEYLLAKPQSALAEAINTLRISLTLLNPDSEVKSLLVTSSVPGEGKSTLCSLLARHSATSGRKTVLVDSDLRRPTIGKIFKLDKNTLGLTDLLMNHELTINDVLVNDPDTGMKIITRGKSAFINPIDLFASQRMRAIVDELKKDFDLVIIDSAPIMAVPDTRILSGLVDKTLFVLNWDSTPKKVVASALAVLNKDAHSNIAGIVLQKVNLEQYGRYGYGDSGYYYAYGRYKNYYTS